MCQFAPNDSYAVIAASFYHCFKEVASSQICPRSCFGCKITHLQQADQRICVFNMEGRSTQRIYKPRGTTNFLLLDSDGGTTIFLGHVIGAKHCSSLCSQSEGHGHVAKNVWDQRRERPERAASSEPRATPWVSAHKCLRPVRAKVWANSWLLLLPLQVGCSKSRRISARF